MDTHRTELSTDKSWGVQRFKERGSSRINISDMTILYEHKLMQGAMESSCGSHFTAHTTRNCWNHLPWRCGSLRFLWDTWLAEANNTYCATLDSCGVRTKLIHNTNTNSYATPMLADRRVSCARATRGATPRRAPPAHQTHIVASQMTTHKSRTPTWKRER